MAKRDFPSMFIAALVFLSVLCVAGIGCGNKDDDDDAATAADDDLVGDDAAADDTNGDDDTSLDHAFPEPFDPTLWGPYAVGNKSYIFVDESRGDLSSRGKRTLLTEVWYPASESARNMPKDVVNSFLGDWAHFLRRVLGIILPAEEIANFDGVTNSVRGAPINKAGGPYPIVIISHGNAAIRFAYRYLGEYLASHGYIAVAPDHIGNAVFVTLPRRLVIYNPLLMPMDAIDRVYDTWFLLDHFTELNENDPDGFFTGLVDVTRAGIAGHSFGGVTGTEWGILDDRVSAILDMAAYLIPIFPKTYHAALMMLTGTEDRTLGDALWAMKDGYLLTPAPKYFMAIKDAGHYSFTDACTLIPTLMGGGDGCGSNTRQDTGEPFDFIDYNFAHRIVQSYATAFFGLHLKGQAEMGQYLFVNRYPDNIQYKWKSGSMGSE